MPVAGASSSSSNLLYGAGGAAVGAGAAQVAHKIDSAYKLGAWGLGIGVVLAAMTVVSSSDLNSAQTTATNIANNVQSLPISNASTASVTSLATDMQNVRTQLGLLAANQAQGFYAANYFSFTPPIQQNFPVQAGPITPAAQTQTSSNTGIIVIGLAIVVVLVAIVL